MEITQVMDFAMEALASSACTDTQTTTYTDIIEQWQLAIAHGYGVSFLCFKPWK